MSLFLIAACEGPMGPRGSDGTDGADGTSGGNGSDGTDGTPGTPGAPGGDGRGSYLTAPGLAIEVLDAAIAADGTVTATVKLTDGAGVALDRTGKYTAGAVSLSFLVAYLPLDAAGDPARYVSYLTRTATAPVGGATAIQAATESNGTFTEIDPKVGTYRYTFATKVTVAAATATHTIGVYGTRTIGIMRATDDAVLDFLPGGGAVTAHRALIGNAACGQCHDNLSAHGGARKSLELCVLCHTEQTTDPDTGNTVDFRVMIHKLHRGENLPSVKAGNPYRIIGFGGSIIDYSTIVFPQEIARCETCHQSANAAQASAWKTKPSAAACTSCHDDIVFQNPVPAGKKLHGGGTQPETAPCAVCHAPTGSIAGITESHNLPAIDPARPRPVVTIQSVTNSGPGQQPTVTFQVSVGGVPRDIKTSPLSSVRMTFAGPNTDYARWWQATVQGSGASGVLTAVDAAQGIFAYTPAVAAAIPADATGSYTVGIEASNQPGTTRFGALSPTRAFAVTDATAVARRDVVDNAKCNKCHGELAGHGGGRQGVAYCRMCHGPNDVNDDRAPHREGATDVYVHSVDLKSMIHRIHMGEELTQAYVLGGNPSPSVTNPDGTQVNFGETRYPSNRSDCAMCHTGTTYQVPPAIGRLASKDEIRACVEDPAADADAYCAPANFTVAQTLPMGPSAAACTGCHDSPAVTAHAQIMTTLGGVESCATCHGPGKDLDVRTVHGLP